MWYPSQKIQHPLHQPRSRIALDQSFIEFAIEDRPFDLNAFPEIFDGLKVRRGEGEVVGRKNGVDVM